MVWVLILWLQVGSKSQSAYVSDSVAITTQEFANHDACVKAALAVRKAFGAKSGFLCVEKGKAGK